MALLNIKEYNKQQFKILDIIYYILLYLIYYTINIFKNYFIINKINSTFNIPIFRYIILIFPW